MTYVTIGLGNTAAPPPLVPNLLIGNAIGRETPFRESHPPIRATELPGTIAFPIGRLGTRGAGVATALWAVGGGWWLEFQLHPPAFAPIPDVAQRRGYNKRQFRVEVLISSGLDEWL